MNSNTQIVLSILISFLIAFAVLLVVLNSFDPHKNEKKFSWDNLSPKKKIFILGSSQVGQLNTNFIDQYITKYDSIYVVYNLATFSDDPTRRLSQLEGIISTKPVLVVYGIGFRDFGTYVSNTNQQYALPNTQQFFHNVITPKNLIQYDFSSFENPKLTTLTMFRNSFGLVKECEACNEPKTPFYSHDIKHLKIIKTQHELKKEVENGGSPLVNEIPPPPENQNLIALKKIIAALQKNNIKVILFTTPHNSAYLDAMRDSEKQAYSSILKNISKEYDVKIYSLEDKYADLNIWSATDHVSYTKDALIYSDDVAKIILTEFSP